MPAAECVGEEYNLEAEQVRVQFKGAIRKIKDYIENLRSAEIVKEVDEIFADTTRRLDRSFEKSSEMILNDGDFAHLR